MNTLLTKKLKKNSQEYKDVEDAFKASAFLRNHLLSVLDDLLKEELSKKLSDAEYDSPSWAFKQADSIGYARAVEKVKALLTEK